MISKLKMKTKRIEYVCADESVTDPKNNFRFPLPQYCELWSAKQKRNLLFSHPHENRLIDWLWQIDFDYITFSLLEMRQNQFSQIDESYVTIYNNFVMYNKIIEIKSSYTLQNKNDKNICLEG